LPSEKLCGSGKVDDGDVEGLAAALQPDEGVGVHDRTRGSAQRPAVELAQQGVVGEEAGHLPVEVHQRDRGHRG
jgi:hypothetical protein